MLQVAEALRAYRRAVHDDWFDELAGMVVRRCETASAEELGEAMRQGHAFITDHGPHAAVAGMKSEHLLRLPSARGAQDGGLAWRMSQGWSVVGFVRGAVIVRRPLGAHVVYGLEADGSLQLLVGRPKARVLDEFEALAEPDEAEGGEA